MASLLNMQQNSCQKCLDSNEERKNKMKKLLIGICISITLISCSDGDYGGNGDGSAEYTHNQLAERFIYQLNLDPEYEVDLIKSSTATRNFIVVYDTYYGTYDAIDISGYSVVDDAIDYYNNPISAYYDLDIIPGYDTASGYVSTQYRDRNTNLYFEKAAATPKDLAKMAALTEGIKLSKTAEFLSAEFGLSLDRSLEIAKLSQAWKKASKKGMTDFEADSFSTEMLGFSITAGKKAMSNSMAGDHQGLNELIIKASEVNNISPEHVQKLMTKVFGL